MTGSSCPGGRDKGITDEIEREREGGRESALGVYFSGDAGFSGVGEAAESRYNALEAGNLLHGLLFGLAVCFPGRRRVVIGGFVVWVIVGFAIMVDFFKFYLLV